MRRLLYLAVLSAAAVLVLAPAALAQSGDLDCSQFATREAPQAILDANPYGRDIYGLDPNGNGVACEVSANGVAEDGTAAPLGLRSQQPAATTTATAAAAGATAQPASSPSAGGTAAAAGQLAHTGGPPLAPVVPVAAALLVGCGASGLLLAARLARRGA